LLVDPIGVNPHFLVDTEVFEERLGSVEHCVFQPLRNVQLLARSGPLVDHFSQALQFVVHFGHLLLQINVLMLGPEAVLECPLLSLDRCQFNRSQLSAVIIPALVQQSLVVVQLGLRVVEVRGMVGLFTTTLAASAFVIDELLELRLHHQFFIASKSGAECFFLLPLSLGIALPWNVDHCR